jgi:hypothetical protein
MRISFLLLAAVVVCAGAAACGGSAADDAFKAARPLWQDLRASVEDRPALKSLLTTEAQAADEEARLENLLSQENAEAYCEGVDKINTAFQNGLSFQDDWHTFAKDLITPALEEDFTDEQIEEMSQDIGDALIRLENESHEIAAVSALVCAAAKV